MMLLPVPDLLGQWRVMIGIRTMVEVEKLDSRLAVTTVVSWSDNDYG